MKRVRFYPAIVALGALATVAGCASANQRAARISTDVGSANSGSSAVGHAAGPADTVTFSCRPNGVVPTRPLPSGFVPVKATQCVEKDIDIPGNGTWRVRDEQVATGGLSALVAVLRLPSQSPSPGQACTAIGMVEPLITLTDAHGATVIPDYPHEACGLPLPEVSNALRAMTWKTTSETKVEQVNSELAKTSGCSQQYKGVIAMAAASSGNQVSGSVAQPAPPASGAMRICRYNLDPANPEHLGGPNGPATQDGVLASSTTLSASVIGNFVTAVAAAPPAASCAKPQAPFAIVGDYAVELSGCYRVLGPAGLRQLTPAVVAALH